MQIKFKENNLSHQADTGPHPDSFDTWEDSSAPTGNMVIKTLQYLISTFIQI